ncbi:hypothetical protein [Marinomonas sp. CT5]|uniref:hypothetical protein n=1 Tax=Marinomonas sp. CT5 TaxID=2066133 RepID=UPI001BB0839F|nr:hypothetical protein [Marinomonas sp. CT5]
MTYGFEVTINGTQVKLDDEYKNIVLLGKKTVQLSAGYQEVSLSEFAHENLTTCIRHLGLGVSFFGYIYSNGKRSGLRLYASAAGNAELALLVPFFPMPEQGYGVILYSESGEQKFHSDHVYFDVKNTGDLSVNPINTNKDMYVLSNPESPSLKYYPYYEEYQLPVYGQVPYESCQTLTRPVSTCEYINGEYTCTTTYESYQDCTTIYKTEIVGYRTESNSWVNCTKTIGMVKQSIDGNLSKVTVTLQNNQYVYGFHDQDSYNHFTGLSFSSPANFVVNPPSDKLAFSSRTITCKAIV